MKRQYTVVWAILFSIFLHFQSHADNHVEWSAQIKNTDESKATLEIKGTIEPGWHMYTTDMPAEGAEPLTFRIENIEGATPVGEFTVRGNCNKTFDNIFKMKLDRYSGSVTASIPLQTSGSKSISISGSVLYMASSDDGKFLPPTTAGFSVEAGTQSNEKPSVDSTKSNTYEPDADNKSTPQHIDKKEETNHYSDPETPNNNGALMTYIGVLALFTAVTFGLCLYLLIQVIKLKKKE